MDQTVTIDVAIVGGGIVGLAAACAVAGRGHGACVLERLPRFGLEASTHNSSVIHAGLYYPAGSRKAALCVEGRERLYPFCAEQGVPAERCGKLVVAADGSETPRLEALAERARGNGVDDVELVDRAFVRRRESHVEAVAALWSPSTGIIEPEARVAGEHDVALLPGSDVEAAVADDDAVTIRTPRETIRARAVVNAAGLYADEVSARLGGEVFTIYPVRSSPGMSTGSCTACMGGGICQSSIPTPTCLRSRKTCSASPSSRCRFRG